MRRLLALATILLTLPAGVWAQNGCHGVNPEMCTHYNLAATYSLADNLAHAQTTNSWHNLTTGGPPLRDHYADVEAGVGIVAATLVDGTVLIYNGTTKPHGFVAQTNMGKVQQIALQYDGNIWSLQSTSICTPSGQYGIFQWTGSAWTQPNPSMCLTRLTVAKLDGTLFGIGGTGNYARGIWYSTNNGIGWNYIIGQWQDVTAVDVNDVLAAGADGGMWIFDATQGPSPTFTSFVPGQAATRLAEDAYGELYVIGTDQNVYHYNGASFDEIVGPGGSFISLANGGLGMVWGLTVVGTQIPQVFHLNDQAITVSLTLSGNTTCTPSCPTALHHKQIPIKLKNSYTGGQTITGPKLSPPGDGDQITAQDTTGIFDCIDDPTGCFDESFTVPQVICNLVGGIFIAQITQLFTDAEAAATNMYAGTKPPSNCSASGVHKHTYCTYPTGGDACTPTTEPPDSDPRNVREDKTFNDQYQAMGHSLLGWFTIAECTRTNFLGIKSSWQCQDPPFIAFPFYNPPYKTMPLRDCTKAP